VAALYIIATPIGNLEDISLRALRLLREVKLIAAEDTRTTRNLLRAYNIKASLTSYHEHNKQTKLRYLLNCLKEGDVALVSDAGMPGLSDTGYELITAAIDDGIQVVPVPGASAVLAGLVASGLPTDQFIYLGFLPRRSEQRRRLLQAVSEEPRTLIAFETPHRLLHTLKDVIEVLGDRQLAVCRELTKLHEEIYRSTVSQAIEHFSDPRGEFTLVLSGKDIPKPEIDKHIEIELRRLHMEGYSARKAVSEMSQMSGIPRNKLYQTWLKIVKGEKE
jgi:16S rRNA (cytidine1402-2'-O)-methyltransferase